MLKLVIDANILISAYAFDGEVRRYWRNSLGAHKLIVSPEILIEVENRLRHGEFDLTQDQIRSIVADIVGRCEIVRPVPARDDRFADPTDAHLAALASYRNLDGVAPQVLLTGDARLLALGTLRGCRVMQIGVFCNSELANAENPT